MAIKVGGTTVIDNSRNVDNIGTIKGLNYPSVDGTADQFLKTDGAGTLSFSSVAAGTTVATLTKSFASGETSTIALSLPITTAPVVSVIKEVSQTGVTSKGAWDVDSTASNYDFHDEAPATSLSFDWDIPSASYFQTGAVAVNSEVVREGLFFKPDGTKVYTIGKTNDSVYEFALTSAWDISTATYVQSFDISSEEVNPTGLSFKPDGTKMYIIGVTGDGVNEYDLSTAWDISTSVLNQTFSVSAQETAPEDIFFKPDGTKMYIVGSAGDDVNEYDLSTAWDVSTAVFLQNFSVAIQDTEPSGIFFREDGLQMYIVGTTGRDVNKYSLSTAWDVSTASYVENFSVGGQEGTPTGLFFKPNGTKMYVIGGGGDGIYEYDIPVVAELGTGSFSASDVGKRIVVADGGSATVKSTAGVVVITEDFSEFSYTSGNWSLYGLNADPENGITPNTVIENAWVISDSSFVQSFSVSAQETSPEAVFFKPDGTKMYVMGTSGDDVNEYDLSTAWDVSTASFVQSFSVGGQEGTPNGLFFKPDGTKMYVVGQSGDDVNEYDLSTAWDVSTASFVQSFSVSTEETAPEDIFFKPDGTKMYIVGNVGQDVGQYDLSTAWDVSTASFIDRIGVQSQDTDPTSVSFKPDGTKMYVLGIVNDSVYEYDLSTAWEVNSASYLRSFSVGGQEGTPNGLFLRSDGTKMYVIGQSGDDVNEYNIGSIVQPTQQYLVGVTSTGGQIDSTYWLDINAMTVDEDLNSGLSYYAVSTDDHTTWSVIKNGVGVRPIVRNNAGTWQYNSNLENPDAWDTSLAVYAQTFSVSGQETAPQGLFFKPDGTKMYICGEAGDGIDEYDLSTAWDISTATANQFFSTASQDTQPHCITFKPDGTKMYIGGEVGGDVIQYDLSVAWDISSATYTQNFVIAPQPDRIHGLVFKSDGLKMYVLDDEVNEVQEYTLSTAWDISTASYDQNFSTNAQDTSSQGLFFKGDGTKMYTVARTNDNVYEYALSTAWDISTASYTDNLFVGSRDTSPSDLYIKPDGSQLYVVGSGNANVYQYTIGADEYTTSTTWTNATTNDELYALQEALVENEFNRMDKAQLEAVQDPNHYTLGDTLDLMVALYMPLIDSDAPTSDGVSIGYDAETLNKGAVLGVDYDFDLPESDVLRITALAANNLKIRVL
jgi:DNA-binding beta-propeller fold protein YncE